MGCDRQWFQLLGVGDGVMNQKISQLERIKQKVRYLEGEQFIPTLSYLKLSELGISESEWMQILDSAITQIAARGTQTVLQLRKELAAELKGEIEHL